MKVFDVQSRDLAMDAGFSNASVWLNDEAGNLGMLGVEVFCDSVTECAVDFLQ